MHGPLPLQLQAQGAIELQCRSEKDRSTHGFAQGVANRDRVLAMLEQRAPGSIEVNDVTSNRIVLEQKSVQAIAIVHETSRREIQFSVAVGRAYLASMGIGALDSSGQTIPQRMSRDTTDSLNSFDVPSDAKSHPRAIQRHLQCA